MHKIGVIIGRFQTPYLHEGHKYLLSTVDGLSDRVIVLVGVSLVDDKEQLNKRNPHTYNERAKLIHVYDKDVFLMPLLDKPGDDAGWSKQVDTHIEAALHIMGLLDKSEVMLYHSRDSFVWAYSGKYPTQEIPELPGFLATKIREELKNGKEGGT